KAPCSVSSEHAAASAQSTLNVSAKHLAASEAPWSVSSISVPARLDNERIDVNGERPLVGESREQIDGTLVGAADDRVKLLSRDGQVRVRDWNVVSGSHLEHAIVNFFVRLGAAELRRLRDRVGEAIVLRVRHPDAPGPIRENRHNRQAEGSFDHAQWIWCSMRSQRVRVKKCANTETRPFNVAPAPSS